MKVQKVNKQHTSFKSGLTFSIIKDIRHTNIQKSQAELKQIGMDADFNGEKAICANFIHAANILSDITDKYKLPFNFVPFSVRVYKTEELIKQKNYLGFCISDTGNVLKNELPFIGGSIFMNKNKNGLFQNDFYATKSYLQGKRSSSHFLSNTFHEWFHAILMDLIYKKYGYEGQCPILRENYHKDGMNKGIKKYKSLDNRDKSSLSDEFKRYIGKYAWIQGNMHELIAELLTKITVNSLDKNLNIIKNPLDNLPKDIPLIVREQLERVHIL